MTRSITKTAAISVAALALPLSLGACAENYAGEGAAVGALGGAAIGAITGGSVAEGAAIGAAVGGAAGYFIDKNDRCDGYDRRGRLDDDCYGTRGYPARRP